LTDGATRDAPGTDLRFSGALPHVAHVALARPAFKGDAAAAVRRSRAGLEQAAAQLGFVLTVPSGGAERHPRNDAPFSPGVVTDVPEAQRVAAALSADPPDLLLLEHATFATGELIAPLVAAAPRVAVWALPESGPGTGPLPQNALCGLQMTLSLFDTPQFGRRGEPVRWFHGEVHEQRFAAPFARTIAALRAVRALEQATVVQIGGTAPGFYALEEAPAALHGVRVVDRSLGELFGAISEVPDEEAHARAEAAREGHDVEVDEGTLLRAARIEGALERLADEVGAQALAGGPAILMDLSDIDEAADALLLWHCGNAPAAWADPDGARPRLTTHFNRDDVGPVRDQPLRPGPSSALRLLDGGRTALVAGGSFVGAKREGFDGVRGWWTAPSWAGRRLPARRFLAELLEQRVPHHLALAQGDHQAVLAEACFWLGIEVRPVEPRPFAIEADA